MTPSVTIIDLAMWIEHVDNPLLRERLRLLSDAECIEVDGIEGSWIRIKTERDGGPAEALKPVGTMEAIWGDWYKTRRGETISVREVEIAESYLKTVSTLFPEWESNEDGDAFRHL